MPEIFTSIPIDSSENWIKVWKIEEPIDFFKTIPLDWYETILKNKKSAIQKSESLAARYCLFEICKTLNVEYAQLDVNENGAPLFIDSDLEISLTHSYPYVAAIVCQKKSIGIDIEKKGRKILKIAPRFLNEREFERWQNDHIQLTLAWSMKESIYKACKTPGLSFQNAINLSENFTNPFTSEVENESLNIYWEIFDEFVLSVAVKK